jgi:hypothetical protein
MAQTYAQRLQAEGATLAAVGAAGSAVLLATQPEARRQPLNTVGQLALVAAGLAYFGPRSTGKALGGASRVRFGRVGTGEPTPLWHIPVPVLAEVAFFAVVSKKALARTSLPPRVKTAPGWDAGLRVTAGSALVGAYQSLVIARQVKQAEARRLRTYYRMPGSRLGRGTVLGWTRRLPALPSRSPT